MKPPSAARSSSTRRFKGPPHKFENKAAPGAAFLRAEFGVQPACLSLDTEANVNVRQSPEKLVTHGAGGCPDAAADVQRVAREA